MWYNIYTKMKSIVVEKDEEREFLHALQADMRINVSYLEIRKRLRRKITLRMCASEIKIP